MKLWELPLQITVNEVQLDIIWRNMEALLEPRNLRVLSAECSVLAWKSCWLDRWRKAQEESVQSKAAPKAVDAINPEGWAITSRSQRADRLL